MSEDFSIFDFSPALRLQVIVPLHLPLSCVNENENTIRWSRSAVSNKHGTFQRSMDPWFYVTRVVNHVLRPTFSPLFLFYQYQPNDDVNDRRPTTMPFDFEALARVNGPMNTSPSHSHFHLAVWWGYDSEAFNDRLAGGAIRDYFYFYFYFRQAVK